MNKVALIALAVLTPVAASAADLPARTSAPAPAPSAKVNWSGFYMGANLGYAGVSSSFTHLENGATTGESFTNKPNSVLGGLQTGARYQFQNNFVVGAEFTYDFRHADDETRTDLNATPRNRRSEVGNLWELSGNVGYSFDRYLAYVKAGYANTKLKYSNIRISTGAVLGQSSDNVGGYVLGAGVEYAFTSNVSLGAEYNYYRFSVSNQQQYDTAGAAVAAINASNKLTSNVGLLKLNYKF